MWPPNPPVHSEPITITISNNSVRPTMWPDTILRQFATVPPNPSVNDYRGPYNKLLYTLFPAETDFAVVPVHLPDLRRPTEYIDAFEIYLVDRPVLILTLKPPSHLSVPSKRQAADEQVRVRMAEVTGAWRVDERHRS